jgi:serine/threonine protein kinase
MGAVAGQCPPLDELDRLLAERLSDAERDAVEAHVESCSSCQQWLDSRVGTPATLTVPVPDESRQDPVPEPDPAFLDRLKRLSSQGPPLAPPEIAFAAWLENGRLGQYEVFEKLGQGGMGAVYRARHVELGKFVALKVLPADHMHEVSVARFKREVRAVGQLEHPNIVAAHDAGQIRGIHYLVMALVDGVDLGRLVACEKQLRVADACEIARQSAAGLQYAAEHGLVHRDVKPSNLMVARDGVVKLLDLGLARSTEDAPAGALTGTGVLLGTADYLAPEQWDRPHAVDSRADIYGLGCTLYHLLTGGPPFSGEAYESVFSKMRAHIEESPLPVDAHRLDLPAGLAAVVAKMMAKNPADRFASPAEVATALQPFATGADLTLLNGARVSDPDPSAATIRPGAPQCETRPERLPVAGRGAATSTGRRRAVAGLIGIGFLLAAGSFGWWYPWQGQAGPVETPAKISGLQVVHYRGRGETLVGDVRAKPETVRLDDDVRVSARLPKAAYCYLIGFNPDGTVQLCLPAGEDGEGAPTARPESREAVEYPARNQLFILDSAGLQVFVLVASAKPLPPFADWKSRAGAIPWKAAADADPWCWQFDGREFVRFPEQRGHVEDKFEVPRSFRDLCEYFKRRAEFDAVQAVAFRVAKLPK